MPFLPIFSSESTPAVNPAFKSLLAFWMGGASKAIGSQISLSANINAISTVGATVNRNAGIDGSTDVSGDGEFDGRISNSRQIASSINSRSSLNGILNNSMKAATQISSRTTIGAASNRNTGVDGSTDISGDGEFDGIASISRLINAQIFARSTVGAIQNLNAGLDGSSDISGDSDFDGISKISRNIFSDLRGRSNLSATLTIAILSLQGIISGRGTFGAAANRNAGIDGSINISGDSDFDGQVSRTINNVGELRSSTRFTGQLSVQSSSLSSIKSLLAFWMGGASLPQKVTLIDLQGNLNGRSTIGAAPNLNNDESINVSLDSEFDGISTIVRNIRSDFTGSSDIGGSGNLNQNIRTGLNGLSSLSGTLTTSHAGVIELIASIFARSTVGAAANRNAGLDGSTDVSGDSDFDAQSRINRNIYSQISGNSNTTSYENVLRGIIGNINGRSTIGAASNLESYRYTDVSIDSDFDGILAQSRLINGILSSSAYLYSQLGVLRSLFGNINGQSFWNGNLTVASDHDRPLLSIISGISRIGASVAINRQEIGQGSSNGDLDGVLSISRHIISDLDAASFIGANISRIIRFSSQVGSSSHTDFDANLGLLHNIISNIRGQSSLSAQPRYLLGLFADIDGQSRLVASAPLLSMGVIGGIGGITDQNIGLRVDHSLLSHIFGQSAFNGLLTKTSIDVSGLEIVRFTLRLIKNPNFTLRHIREKDFELSNIRQKELVLER